MPWLPLEYILGLIIGKWKYIIVHCYLSILPIASMRCLRGSKCKGCFEKCVHPRWCLLRISAFCGSKQTPSLFKFILHCFCCAEIRRQAECFARVMLLHQRLFSKRKNEQPFFAAALTSVRTATIGLLCVVANGYRTVRALYS